jgi:hypothetical protein
MLKAGHVEAYREFSYSFDAERDNDHGRWMRPDRFSRREGNHRDRSIFWREPRRVLHGDYKCAPMKLDTSLGHPLGGGVDFVRCLFRLVLVIAEVRSEGCKTMTELRRCLMTVQ